MTAERLPERQELNHFLHLSSVNAGTQLLGPCGRGGRGGWLNGWIDHTQSLLRRHPLVKTNPSVSRPEDRCTKERV